MHFLVQTETVNVGDHTHDLVPVRLRIGIVVPSGGGWKRRGSTAYDGGFWRYVMDGVKLSFARMVPIQTVESMRSAFLFAKSPEYDHLTCAPDAGPLANRRPRPRLRGGARDAGSLIA